MNEELLFRRGYLITDNRGDSDPPAPVADWDATVLSEHTIWFHPDLPTAVCEGHERRIAVLGTVYDPIEGRRETRQILRDLDDALATGEGAFFEALDTLSGRFVLFVEAPETTIAVSDAAGTRPLYYDCDPDRILLSSNPEIIASVTDANRSEFGEYIIASDESYFPGVSTPYSNVKRVTPNTVLRLPEHRIERFYPRGPLESRDLTGSLVREIADILRTQMRMLNEERDLGLTLSAGIDSRVSFAATREIADDVAYYTWAFPELYEGETTAVERLCDRVGLSPRVVDISDEAPPAFVDVFMEHTSGMALQERADRAFNFYEKFPDELIEVRSNVAEVARAYYRTYISGLPDGICAEDFSKLYYRANGPQVDDAFREFITVTDFTAENTYNYDPYDLFYWENRMGSWLSQLLMEKDVSHENYIVYNNRRLLELLLSVDRPYRRKNELFRRLARNMWPECMDVPINPHESEGRLELKPMRRLARGMVMRAPSPIYNRGIELARRVR